LVHVESNSILNEPKLYLKVESYNIAQLKVLTTWWCSLFTTLTSKHITYNIDV